MQKTNRFYVEEELRRHVPLLANVPALRCGHVVDRASGRFCNAVACWRSPGQRWLEDSARCPEHASESDRQAFGELVVRRVRISCDILLGGVTLQAPAAHRSAVELLGEMVGALGGIVEVQGVSSVVGRWSNLRGPGATIGAGGCR